MATMQAIKKRKVAGQTAEITMITDEKNLRDLRKTQKQIREALACLPTEDTVSGLLNKKEFRQFKAIEQRTQRGGLVSSSDLQFVRKVIKKANPACDKKPLSAFLLFSAKLREDVKNETVTLTDEERQNFAKMAGVRWRGLPESEKAPFIQTATAAFEEFKETHPGKGTTDKKITAYQAFIKARKQEDKFSEQDKEVKIDLVDGYRDEWQEHRIHNDRVFREFQDQATRKETKPQKISARDMFICQQKKKSAKYMGAPAEQRTRLVNQMARIWAAHKEDKNEIYTDFVERARERTAELKKEARIKAPAKRAKRKPVEDVDDEEEEEEEEGTVSQKA